MEACRKGELDEAEDKLLAALRLTKNKPGGCTEIKVLTNLGIVYELRGEKQKALLHYESARQLVAAKNALKHPLYFRLTDNITRVS
jgi:Flp pilus assembly protein TadD